MNDIPECIWDAAHGLIVLYRWGDRAPGSFNGYQLVIELAGGGEAYYAGELPADRGIWVVKAPQQGQFRLAFYPPGSPRLLDGGPVAAVPFDDRSDQPVGMRHRLAVWLFPSAAGLDGEQRPEPEAVLVEDGETVEEGLDRHGWQYGDPDGLAVYRLAGDTLDALRGPAVHPFRHLADEIDVVFTLVPDYADVPEDLVILDGFDRLSVPAIVIDLTAFGYDAESEREYFHFIHRPHDPDAGPRYIRGAEVEIQDDEGKRYLYWPCDDACHLDYLGVYHAGGKPLRPHGDERAQVQLVGHERLESASALMGMFYGDAYRLYPMHEIDLNALKGQANADGPATAGSELRLNTAWAGIEERWPNVDLEGADNATAFTLMAYVEFLEQLSGAEEAGGDVGLPGLMDRNGVPYHRFSAFARRPDLCYALVAEPDLVRLLGNSRLQTDALLDAGPWSPTASLAAALEPGDAALPPWVDAESSAVQRALWLFMLAGGEASVWRDLAIPLEAVDDGLDKLVARLRVARTEPLPGFVAPTVEDLGLDSRVLDGPPRTFPDAMARVEVIAEVEGAFDSELAAVNQVLRGDLEGLRLDKERLVEAFTTDLDQGEVPAAADLKRQVMVLCAPLGKTASELLPLLMGLKTRVVLWGLARVLGDVVKDTEGTEAVHEDGAAPPKPTAPAGPAAADPEATEEDIGEDGEGREADAAGSDATGPRVTDLTVVVHWLLGVLEHGELEYPPPAVDPGTEGIDGLLAEAEGLLEDVEDFWGLLGAGVPQPLPRWTGTRAREGAQMDVALDRACRQARHDLDVMSDGTDADRNAIRKLLDRVEQIRSYLVADAVWAATRERARWASTDSRDPKLEALRARMYAGGSEDWEGLAAELDSLLAAP